MNPSSSFVQRPADRGAFTLVELLVVVGIIGLLIAIVLPAMARAREQAVHVQCMSNLRQIGLAYRCYENDHGRFPANAYEMGDTSTFAASIAGPTFDTRPLLKPYMSIDYFACPGIAPWKPSEATTPVVNIDYVIAPGYYGDAQVDDVTNPATAKFSGQFWVKSHKPWRYGPYRMTVVAGDRLYLDPITLPGVWRHVVNHPGRGNGYGEWSPPGFAGSAWLALHAVGNDRRNQLRGNFLYSDGSVTSHGPGSCSLVRVPNRNAQRLGSDYLLPTQP